MAIVLDTKSKDGVKYWITVDVEDEEQEIVELWREGDVLMKTYHPNSIGLGIESALYAIADDYYQRNPEEEAYEAEHLSKIDNLHLV